MKRKYVMICMLVIILVIGLTISGCSLFGKSTPAPKPTLAPAPQVQATLPPAPKVQPTLPPPPAEPTLPPPPPPVTEPQADSPTQAPEVAAPSPAPQQPEQPQASGPEYFAETFQSEIKNWTFKWVNGNSQENAEITPGGGIIKVLIPRGEESSVKFFKEGVNYDDVAVSLIFRNYGDSNNGVSLLCRVNDKGFYEFRVSSGGRYSIYRYENALKEKGVNPYVFIGDGASQYLITGLDKENVLQMNCKGKNFEYSINGKKIKTTIPLSLQDQYAKYKSGGVGFGVISFNETAGSVDVEISKVETKASQ